jgi:uncharacterized protein (TIGR02466 family)
MKYNKDILGLFPTPLGVYEIDKELSENEINFFKKEQNNSTKNIGNYISKNKYILNNKEMQNLKIILENCLNDFYLSVFCPKYESKLYITQSWLNFTQENEYHHYHNHSNSFLSGVFYISSDPKIDNIILSKNGLLNSDIFNIETENFNEFNSKSYTFPTKSKTLIIFPSKVSHEVLNKKSNNLRISMAFNSFLKGKIGENENLTELIL